MGLKLLHFMPNSFLSFETDFLVGKKLQLPSFVDCLKERGTVQMLTIGRDAAIEVQVCPCKKKKKKKKAPKIRMCLMQCT